MPMIDRNKMIAEELIREHVRKRIQKSLNEKQIFENRLRQAIRRLVETETGSSEPSTYTGINVLADLLEKVVPIVEDDYKMLTTATEQRESFRNHIIHAIKNSLRPIESVSTTDAIPEHMVFELDRTLLEKMKIDLSPEGEDAADEVEGEFIDIAAPDEQDDFVHIDDQNETGRNFAAVTFNKIEKQIVEAYDMLADEKDQEMFYDYLITNMLLYFDKFEDELQTQLPDTSTPEYEQKKEEEASEGEGEPDDMAAGTEAEEGETSPEEEPAAEEPAAEEPIATAGPSGDA